MYKNISKARNQLMGIAMLMIMFFHTSIKYPKVLDLLKNFGDFGVNIFFLVSGYSMIYAWNKNPDLKAFYKKRFIRILVTYLPIAIGWCSISVLMHECGILEAICKILTIQFWIDGNLLHWFISGILILYLITPFWIRMSDKYAKLSAIVTIGVCSICIIYSYIENPGISIFLYRLPAYFMGLYMGRKAYKNQEPGKIEKWVVNIIGIVGILCFAMIRFDTLNYIWKYIIYILLTPTFVLCVAKIFGSSTRNHKILTFCSAITLETYLLHEKILRIATMIFDSLSVSFDNRLIIINLLCAMGTVMVAYVYSVSVNKILKISNKYKKDEK